MTPDGFVYWLTGRLPSLANPPTAEQWWEITQQLSIAAPVGSVAPFPGTYPRRGSPDAITTDP